MGNVFVKYAWSILFGTSISYSIFYVWRDYRKKKITKIKNLKNGEKVSIEGTVRLMSQDRSNVDPIFERRNNYYLMQSGDKELQDIAK